MRSLDRLSGSDQDCGDREMYIDLDDASVDSLTGKRTRHHVAEEESDSSGSERSPKQAKRRNRGSAPPTTRRRKSGISARERNLRRLESNERERMRMHSLNDAFEVIVYCFLRQLSLPSLKMYQLSTIFDYIASRYLSQMRLDVIDRLSIHFSGIRSDRVIGRLVICRDNDNGVLRPTSINVCDEGTDKLES
ncbi:hypothetical protein ALC56_06759 [Trachymyrmex septentrionalis]|uniref:BHLH domain-containing protein n=1 Tax=Trachymyrmex septentrionalis TaxID=34720 RepID=A0A195FDM1_9HYME|nr:hypothetical protein ALC56_06759 [Trachymyrmex septentrionalis]